MHKRLELELTQEDMALELQMKHRSYVNYLEAGRRDPRAHPRFFGLDGVVAAYNLTQDELWWLVVEATPEFQPSKKPARAKTAA